jgi:hypothetical protein
MPPAFRLESIVLSQRLPLKSVEEGGEEVRQKTIRDMPSSQVKMPFMGTDE